MTVSEVRLRHEPFGYTVAQRNGNIGFYSHEAGPSLLRGITPGELEKFSLKELPATKNFHLSAPLIVWFEITKACNLPCKHCYVTAGKARKNELTTEEIFGVLDNLKQMGVFAIVLVGGEPMAHPDFIRILRYAHELGFVISIATNGTYITQAIIDELPREECVVSVSLDGTASHKELRVLTTFEEVRERLMLLKRNSISTAIMTTLTDRNVHELNDVFEFAQENDFFFGTAPFSPIGRGRHFRQYIPGIEVVEDASQLYVRDIVHEKKKMQRIGLCVTKFLEKCYSLYYIMRREFCGIALGYILSDGSVYPCSCCAATEKYIAGNVRNTPFSELWETSFEKIRQITFDDFKGCKSCELAKKPYFCTARCPVMSEVYTGDPFQCGATPYLKESLKRKTELIRIHGITH